MRSLLRLTLLLFVASLNLGASPTAPEAAIKYHKALLKRTDNDTLYERFVNAWLDEQPLESLEKYLNERAEKNGGQDLALLARYHVRRKDGTTALATLTKAIAALPDDASLRLERAKIHLRQLSFDPARSDLESIIKNSDENLAAEATKLIGKSYIKEGRPKEAIKAWDALLASRPGDQDLLEDLLESAASEGEYEQALIYADQLIAQTSDPYQKTLRSLRRGDLLAANNQHDDAVKTYRAALAKVGEGSWLEGEILAQIESLYTKQDRIDDLKNILGELAEQNPQRFLIHRKLAKLEAAQGQVDEAIGRFREVLRRSPGQRDLREEFVRLLTDSERFEEATKELRTLLQSNPDDAELHLQLASIYHQMEAPSSVEENLKTARKLLGDNEASSLRIANLFLKYDLSEQGEALLQNLAAKTDASPLPAQALATEYARTGRNPEAIKILTRLAKEGDLETLLRSASSLGALREQNTAFELLSTRAEEFTTEKRFLASIIQAGIAAEKAPQVTPLAVKFVRLAERSKELEDNIGLALRAITAANESGKWREQLNGLASPTPAEKALQAGLAELQADFGAVDEILKGQKDPILIRFYAGILDRRGAFDEAIDILTLLEDQEEGRKASFFKDLSDLQQRAGKTEEAIETVTRWQQTSPGDKTAWLNGTRLLEKLGKTEEAIRMTRQAVSRFEGDADLSAILASQYQSVGRTKDALAIFWKLYDESDSPAGQVRWATQLANLAVSSGGTEALEEKLRGRARSNRKSTGPILALAELARALGDEDKRRNLLLEAMRLQPQNVDLRLQIAGLEEQSGNLERVITLLEEPIKGDKANRVQSALAQAYLRQGQTIKGMRVLRSIANENGRNDPRAIEASAASLASAGLYEEAIYYLQESLPQGGDWRSKYLLALLMAQDGRESEALPIFKELLTATGEVMPSQPSSNSDNPYLMSFSADVRALLELNANISLTTFHENKQSFGRSMASFGGVTSVSGFALPDTLEKVHAFALIHLAKLAETNQGRKDEFLQYLKSTGIQNGDFLFFYISNSTNHQPNIAAIFAEYSDVPGVLELALMYASHAPGTSLNTDTLEKSLLKAKDQNPSISMAAWAYLLSQQPENETAKEEYLEAIRQGSSSPKEEVAQTTLQQALLHYTLRQPYALPDTVQQELGVLLKNIDLSAITDPAQLSSVKLGIAAAVGEPKDLVAAINEEDIRFRSDEKAKLTPLAESLEQLRQQMARYANYNPWGGGLSMFRVPELERLNLKGLSPLIQQVFFEYPGMESKQRKRAIEKLLPKITDISSPSLQLWLALKAGDLDTIERIAKQAPPSHDELDFLQLRAIAELKAENYSEAFESLLASRSAYLTDANLSQLFNTHAIGIALKLEPEAQKKAADQLRPILLQIRQQSGTQSQLNLADLAKRLGLKDLEKRFTPPPARQLAGSGSRIGPSSIRSSSRRSNQQSSGSLEKLKKFIADEKVQAAAREALLVYRQNKQNSFRRSRDLEELREALTEKVLEALVESVDPGSSKSLTKRLEYVDICLDFDLPELALKELKRLYQDRPNDPKVLSRLAFLLPPEDATLAHDLLTKAASSEDFVNIAAATAQRVSDSPDPKANIKFFQTVEGWLRSADQLQLKDANLSWIAYYGNEYADDGPGGDIPGVLELPEDEFSEDKDYLNYRKSARGLFEAMLPQASISEAGFRLLSASKAWELSIEEKDRVLQSVLLAGSMPSKVSLQPNPFALMRGTGGFATSSGEHPDHSAGIYLAKRLGEVEKPNDLVSADLMGRLKQNNPDFATSLKTVLNLEDQDDLSTLLQAKIFRDAGSPLPNVLKTAAMLRAPKIPGAPKFFLEEAKKISPIAIAGNRYNPATLNQSPIITTMLRSALNLEGDDALDAAIAEIKRIYFPDGMKWEAEGSEAQNLSFTFHLIQQFIEPIQSDGQPYLRLSNALYKADLPAGSNSYSLSSFFNRTSFATVEEATEFLKSLGLLNDLKAWKFYRAVFAEPDYQGPGQVVFEKTETFVNHVAFEDLRTEFSDRKLREHLEKLEPQTFGTLIAAATLADGSERQELTEKAFKLAQPELEGLDEEKIGALLNYVTWLPSTALKDLPDAFQQEFKNADAERLKSLRERADVFLTTPPTSTDDANRSFSEMEEVLEQLTSLDLEKASEVFLECERRYTKSLGNSGNFSRYQSSGLRVSIRDQHLSRILRSDDGALSTNPALAIQFYQAIAQSPEGQRFSFTTSRKKRPLLEPIGETIQEQNPSSKKGKHKAWLPPYQWANDQDETIRRTALLAVFLHQTCFNRLKRITGKPGDRKKLEEMEGLDGMIKQLHSASISISKWKDENQENKNSTISFLAELLNDETLPLPTRIQLLAVVHERPALLQHPELANAVSEVFEEYATAGRSIVNRLGIDTVTAVNKIPGELKNKEALQEIHDVFWANANKPSEGGHSPIMDTPAKDLFNAAVRLEQVAVARKLLSAAHSELQGDSPTLSELIVSGHFDLALALLNPANRVYRKDKFKIAPYTATFEKQLKEFKEFENVGDMAFLRLEAQFLEAPEAPESERPLETLAERELRIARAYRAAKPSSPMLRTELLSTLTRDSHLASIELRDELLEHVADLDLNRSIEDWRDNVGSSSDPAPRRNLAPAETALFRQSAYAEWFHGNVEPLQALVDICEKQLKVGKNRRGGAITDFMERIIESSPLWIAEAIHQQKTEAFSESFEIYSKLALAMDSHDQYPSYYTEYPMAFAQFMAHWNGEPAKFTELQSKIKRHKKRSEVFNEPRGYLFLGYTARNHLRWRSDCFADARRSFILSSITRPSMKAYFGTSLDYLFQLGREADLKEDYLAITKDIPENTLDEVRPSLLYYKGRKALENDKLDEARLAYEQAIEANSTPEWRNFRASLRGRLSDVLITQGKIAEAKEVYASIPKDDVAKWFEKRYQETGKKLAESAD